MRSASQQPRAIQPLPAPSNRIESKEPKAHRPVKSAIILDVYRNGTSASKGYAYQIDVRYVGSPEEPSPISRNFDNFFELHMQLLGHFPDAAGIASHSDLLLKDPNNKDRILPQLPVQMMYVSDAVALARLSQLQDYLNVILG
jgi:PX domain